jgi:hypothetical protein
MKIKCPLCGYENKEGSKLCIKCNEPLFKQEYSEDNPYVKRRSVEDQLNNKANEEDEMKERIEKEERIRAEARAKAEKKVKDKKQIEKQKKSGFIETLGLIIFVLWLLRLLGIVDF